jgi:hypothetical protein
MGRIGGGVVFMSDPLGQQAKARGPIVGSTAFAD